MATMAIHNAGKSASLKVSASITSKATL